MVDPYVFLYVDFSGTDICSKISDPNLCLAASLCIISSYVINFMYKPIIGWIDKNTATTRKDYPSVASQKIT